MDRCPAHLTLFWNNNWRMGSQITIILDQLSLAARLMGTCAPEIAASCRSLPRSPNFLFLSSLH